MNLCLMIPGGFAVRLILFSSVLILMLSTGIAFSEINSVNLDKSSYKEGDTVNVSGKVTYNSTNPDVIIQVITPDGAQGAYFNQIRANANGDFSTSFVTGGKTWSMSGTYTLKVSYFGSVEKDLNFSLASESSSDSSSSSTKQSGSDTKQSGSDTKQSGSDTAQSSSSSGSESSAQASSSSSDTKQSGSGSNLGTQPAQESVKTSEPVSSEYAIDKIALKSKVDNFPELDKAPQYYIDRYNNEPDYKAWFDSVFPRYSIEDVVAYSKTRVLDYPDNKKPPQYYIDRYNNEVDYKAWFDSAFPDKTLYEVLGFAEPTNIPAWIKNNVQLWSTEKIDESVFLAGIKFMLENNIIQIPNLPDSTGSLTNTPDWVKDTAIGWASDLTSESEFADAIRYLVKQGVIIVEFR